MIFVIWYIITTSIAVILVGITAKVRGDFPSDLAGRLKVSAVVLVPAINLAYGIVAFLFYRKPQGFA
jgi:hypothetical protein